MAHRIHMRAGALLLLLALLVSATLPRVFVVCVTDDDHVSLEAVFEGDPCETNFIFGARAESGWPTVACTDIPAVQLSALGEADPELVAGAILVAWTPLVVRSFAAIEPRSVLVARTPRESEPPEPSAIRALRTTRLLI
ncbi:MAG: hypothetical protein R3F35_10895 [Myxococcota bacterium]